MPIGGTYPAGVTQKNFHELAADFVQRISELAKAAPDDVLDAVLTIKGDGPLSTQRVRDAVYIQQRERAKRTIWAAYEEVLINPGAVGERITVENTGTGEVKYIADPRPRSTGIERHKFAVETVTQFPVRYAGSTNGRDLFVAE